MVAEHGCAMMVLSDPSLLNSLGQALIVVGLVAVMSLFFFPKGRHVLERSLGLLFTVVIVGGVVLMWRADKLLAADRDLTPAQQTTLSKAISQFPTAKFEVFTSRCDREAYSLALKIVDAVKAGSGAMPRFDDAMLDPPLGVVLVRGAEGADSERDVGKAIGRILMGARIAVIGSTAIDLGQHTVRIVVGPKP
jgi:hypothetical protein